MDSTLKFLRGDERYSLFLRALYENAGFQRYRMGKFEEYSLYMDNKSFLGRRNIITVTSPGGRLLALKPDITLSIVKSSAAAGGEAVRAYYSENVYAPDPDSDAIKEISQVGVEYLDPASAGEDFAPAVAEVCALAAKSLELLGERWVLCLSHMGFVRAILDETGLEGELRSEVTALAADKNTHGIISLTERAGLSEAGRRIAAIMALSGDPVTVIAKARLCTNSPDAHAALDELASLCEECGKNTGEFGRIHLDFSIINDVDYYGGAVMKGYVAGVPRAVLTGGRYDRMAEKLGRGGGAVGFAILMGELERFFRNED